MKNMSYILGPLGIQFGQNLKFGRRENKNLVPETQTQIGEPPFSQQRLPDHSATSITATSKYVSKGLAAEVQARPLRK